MKAPFFIVGSVRSGTTMLRDVLKLHPNLICPEESHIFRWSWPYGTIEYLNQITKNPILAKHREIDGISETLNNELLDTCVSRNGYMSRYMENMSQASGSELPRWFDKTPQHVYGMLLIASEFPESKFIHIYRNPLNVVASLRVGKVIKVDSLVGAINYWNEAVLIASEYARGWPHRCLAINYEHLTKEPSKIMSQICEFVDEEDVFQDVDLSFIRPEKNKYLEVLAKDEIEGVRKVCAPIANRLGLTFKDIND